MAATMTPGITPARMLSISYSRAEATSVRFRRFQILVAVGPLGGLAKRFGGLSGRFHGVSQLASGSRQGADGLFRVFQIVCHRKLLRAFGSNDPNHRKNVPFRPLGRQSRSLLPNALSKKGKVVPPRTTVPAPLPVHTPRPRPTCPAVLRSAAA